MVPENKVVTIINKKSPKYIKMKSPKKTSYVLFMTYFLMYSNLILSLIIVRLFFS